MVLNSYLPRLLLPSRPRPAETATKQVNVLALIEEVRSDDDRDGAADPTSGKLDSTATNDGNIADTPPPRETRVHGGATDESNYDKLLERALAYSRAGADGAGSGFSVLSGVRGEGGGETREIRATAGALVRRLVVEKQECLRTRFHKIPFMPQARRKSNSVLVPTRCLVSWQQCPAGKRGSRLIVMCE